MKEFVVVVDGKTDCKRGEIILPKNLKIEIDEGKKVILSNKLYNTKIELTVIGFTNMDNDIGYANPHDLSDIKADIDMDVLSIFIKKDES